MSENNEHLDEQEKLQAENEFLKMKLMLEKGASFGGSDNELPPEIENIFLKNVMETERIFEEGKMMKVVDKIGRPTHFKPAAEIPDNEIDNAWKELREHLNKHAVDLDACSPNISNRELYRFTLEELFEQETMDIDLPGWTTNFIYDEFYPDPVYDSTQAAVQFIRFILQKEPMEWLSSSPRQCFRLNDHPPLNGEELKQIVNRYKLAYDELEIDELEQLGCIVNGEDSVVTGNYHLTAQSGKERFRLGGNWKVHLSLKGQPGYWYINQVEIEGINF